MHQPTEELEVISCQLIVEKSKLMGIATLIEEWTVNGTLWGADVVVYRVEQNPELFAQHDYNFKDMDQ